AGALRRSRRLPGPGERRRRSRGRSASDRSQRRSSPRRYHLHPDTDRDWPTRRSRSCAAADTAGAPTRRADRRTARGSRHRPARARRPSGAPHHLTVAGRLLRWGLLVVLLVAVGRSVDLPRFWVLVGIWSGITLYLFVAA